MRIIFISFLLMTSLGALAQQITNIRTVEREGKVMIYYDLFGERGTMYEVKAYCSDNNWQVPLHSVTGAVGKNIGPGKNKRITWDVLQERSQLVGNYAFKIKASSKIFHPANKFSNYTDTFAGLNMEMIAVQGGVFTMGSNEKNDEKPPHQVIVSNFYIGKYEVTNEAVCAFLNEMGNQIEGGTEWLDIENLYCLIKKSYGSFVPKNGYAKHPVVFFSWYGAKAFCDWLSKKTGKIYRLPTEAEWEYAAGGGDASGLVANRTKWAGTDNSGSLDAFVWYKENSTDKIHVVGTKKSNPLGLYDMSGNAWEWCQDWYNKDFYKNSTNDNPTNTKKGDYKVLRGGSWSSDYSSCRIAYRYRIALHERSNKVGFRIVSLAR